MLNKLVRDKIVADMQGNGQKVTFRRLNDAEYVQELTRKLKEESGEFTAEDPKEALEELADVLEVVEALAAEFGADFEQLRAVQAERREKRGAFQDRTYISRLDLADDDPWAEYYAKEPDRFKEITE